MLSGLANTPSVAREVADLKNKNITTTDAALQNMLTRGIDPYLAQAVVTTMRMQQAAQMQGARPPQGTVVDKTLSAAQAAPPGLAGMSNPAMERANFAGGGIVAFNGEKGSDVQSNDRAPTVNMMADSAAAEAAPWSDDEEREYRQLADVFSNPLNAPGNKPGNPDVAAKYERFKELKNKRDSRYVRPTNTRMLNEYPGAERLFSLNKQNADESKGTRDTTTGAQTGARAAPAEPRVRTRTPTKTGTSTTKDTSSTDTNTPTTGIASTLDPNDPWASRITAARAEGLGSEQAYRAAEQQRYTDLGIGQAAKKYSEVLAKLKDEYEGSKASDANMKQSIIEFGANLLASKSPYFSVAAGEAAKAGVTGYYGREKENKKMALEVSKATFDLNKAQEDLSLAIDQGGTAKYEKQKARVEALEDKQTTLMGEMLKLNKEGAIRERVANITAKAGQNAVPDVLMPNYRAMVTALNKGDTAEADKQAAIVEKGLGLTPRGYAATQAAESKKETAAETAKSKMANSQAMQTLLFTYNSARAKAGMNPNDPVAKSNLERARNSLRSQLSLGNYTDEEIAAVMGEGASAGQASGGQWGKMTVSP